MQKRLVVAFSFVAVVAVAAPILFATFSRDVDVERRGVAVTWGLLAEVVYRLGDGQIEVHQLIPAGAEVHDWEPTPEAVDLVRRSAIIIYTVEGFDDWALELAEGFDVRVVKASEDAPVLLGSEHGHVDPHLWLDISNVKKMVENIAEMLAAAFPDKRDSIRSNAAKLLEELDGLDSRLAEGLRPYRGRIFITQHDAFQYLARRYGLEAIGILGPEEEEPSSSRLAEIYRIIGEAKIGIIYAEDGNISPILESISRDTGVRIGMLYTGEGLALQDIVDGRGYAELMTRNLDALVEGFENR